MITMVAYSAGVSAAESVQQKGIDGADLAKRWLESTTWIELPFDAYHNASTQPCNGWARSSASNAPTQQPSWQAWPVTARATEFWRSNSAFETQPLNNSPTSLAQTSSPQLSWLCVGLVVTAGDGDVGWLCQYRSGPTAWARGTQRPLSALDAFQHSNV
ncbi:hypothetical protein [Phytohabitans suffuscus]|uniref:hypothetical protein n=1 Tax=Phytohabitans suffuscus TaxID=624315 RepID=UPI00156773D8|nr:hypothetical protein [Phytohabitans suffuscus]